MTVEKAYFFGESRIGQLAMELGDPKKIRDLGDRIKNFNRNQWNTVCDNMMKTALKHKFSDPQAKGARDYLLSTGNRVIGEASKHLYWGAGVLASDPDALDLDEWHGSNTLGLYLMEVRDQIIEEEAQKPKATGNVQNGERSSSSSSFNDVISTPQSQTYMKYAVLFGDGNVPKDLSKCEELLPLKIVDHSKNEMKLSDMQNEAEKCMVPKDDVDFVVMHLGSTQWHESAPIASAQDVFKEVQNAISYTCTVFPKADYVISAVPLRDPSLAGENVEKLTQINLEIGELNRLLRDFAQSERNITYSDNSNIFISEKLPQGQQNHYENSGLLSDQGKCILAENLKNSIKEAVQLNLLSGDWTQVSPQSAPPSNS